MVVCESCGRRVPDASYQMHLAFCARNVHVCIDCGARVPNAEKEQHQLTHQPVECECGELCPADMLATHQAFVCSRRKVVCDYCRLEFTADEHRQHERPCGSRTEKCSSCGAYVMLRHWTQHLESGCEFVRTPELPRADFEDALHPCVYCGAMFDHVDDLMVHQVSAHDDGEEEEFQRAIAEAEAAAFAFEGSDDSGEDLSSLDLDAKSPSPLELSEDD